MDPVFKAFLKKQFEEGLMLAQNSDILTLKPMGPQPVQHFLACFSCKGLVRGPGLTVSEANKFVAGISFPDDYLRRAQVPEVVTLLEPVNFHHPNGRFPFLCIGHLSPGQSLSSLIYQIYEMITYHRFNLTDALNQEACAYARANLHRFPLDRRPLRRVTRAGPTAIADAPKL
jgi:hypothetical protein